MCTSLFHAAYGCALGHYHTLPSASSVHHGFTEYTFCAPTTLKAAYGHIFTPFDSEFCRSLSRSHPLLSVLCVHHGFTEYTVCVLPSVEPKTQRPGGDYHNLSPVSCAIRDFTQHTLVPLPLSQRWFNIHWVIPTPASNLICASWFHIVDDSACIPRNAKADLALGHHQTLAPTSCESHGFTQYMVVPLPYCQLCFGSLSRPAFSLKCASWFHIVHVLCSSHFDSSIRSCLYPL